MGNKNAAATAVDFVSPNSWKSVKATVVVLFYGGGGREVSLVPTA